MKWFGCNFVALVLWKVVDWLSRALQMTAQKRELTATALQRGRDVLKCDVHAVIVWVFAQCTRGVI